MLLLLLLLGLFLFHQQCRDAEMLAPRGVMGLHLYNATSEEEH